MSVIKVPDCTVPVTLVCYHTPDTRVLSGKRKSGEQVTNSLYTTCRVGKFYCWPHALYTQRRAYHYQTNSHKSYGPALFGLFTLTHARLLAGKEKRGHCGKGGGAVYWRPLNGRLFSQNYDFSWLPGLCWFFFSNMHYLWNLFLPTVVFFII